MLFKNVQEREWIENFKKKFIGFSKKAPLLLTFEITKKDMDTGVYVRHVNSTATYFFKFDYEVEPKDFVARIKTLLVEKHYPRIIEDVYENVELTTKDLADRIAAGASPDKISKVEVKKIGQRVYRIDRTISYRNIVILVLEDSTLPEDEVGQMTRHQMTTSVIIFLKRYRENKFKSVEDA
jgi:hypothetical protein